MKSKAIKVAICVLTAASIYTMSAATVRAAHIDPEQAVEGIALSLENYRTAYAYHEDGEADKILTEILMTEIISPYKNLGVSIADNYVNIRKEPNEESDILGKLYRGCSADILERVDDWVRIKSGDVEGYIKAEYLAIGKDAEVMIEDYATKYATVQADGLRVRDDQSIDSKILTLIPEGEKYIVVKEHEEWAEILLGTDDVGADFTGFVSKEFIDISVEFEYAISIEEENRRIEAEQAAIKAEEERLAKLAAEEQAKKAEEKRKADELAKAQKAAEEAKKAAQNNNSSNNSNKNNNSSNNTESSKPVADPPASSSNKNLDSIRQEVVNYALKFVGNPYVYGGTSLTAGADCSGFTSTIYKNFGYGIARDSRSQASSSGKTVSESEMLPGDLIFYTNSSGVVNHVAMYAGNGRIVHAANSRQGIITSQAKYRSIYKVKRIIY